MRPRTLNQNATRTIGKVYALGAEPADSHKVLTDITRAITVIGNLAEQLSKDYGAAGDKPARWVARVGRFFWGVVELSVPNTSWRALLRRWLWLAALVGLVIFVLGFPLAQPNLCGIGAAIVAGSFVVDTLSITFYRYMVTAKFPQKMLLWMGAFVLVGFVVWIAHLWGGHLASGLRWLAQILQWTHDTRWSDAIKHVWAVLKRMLRHL